MGAGQNVMMKKFIDNENIKVSFSKTEIFYLMFLVAIGTIIRFIYHYNRPFVDDEIGTLIYIKESVTFILTHFESWLTMNYFILLEKVLLKITGGNYLFLTIVPEFAGIATIPLTAILAKMVSSKNTALVSATLVAFNPFLISYSGIIRAYSLLAAVSLLTIILFFNWYTNRTLKNGIYLALSCYALMLSHLNGAYTLAYIFSITGLELFFALVKREKKDFLTLIIPLSTSMVITLISYINIAGDISHWGIPWHDTPPTSISYIPYIFSIYFGNGFYGWVSAFFMVTAIFLTIRVHNNPLLILIPFIALSILLVSIQGISHFTDSYARFLIFLVPICVIFIAEGIVNLSAIIPTKNSIAITIFTIFLVSTWVPNFIQGYKEKIDRPWGQVAAFIKNSTDGNIILTNDWLSNLHLTPYFDDTTYTRYELEKYSKKRHTRVGDANNIYFVITGLDIPSDFPVYVFGDIQVIVYPKTTYKDQLIMIQNDLQKRISSLEVSPELTDVYHNLWVLNKTLNDDSSLNFQYYDLYMRCFQLTWRQRNIPLSLQRIELKMAGYNVGK